MLEILLIILKIIGITILVILGLIIAVCLMVLFVPVRYKITGDRQSMDSDYDIKVNVSYLLHIFSVWIVYNNSITTVIKIFGIRLRGRKNNDKNYNEKIEKKSFGNTSENQNINDTVSYEIDWNEEDTDAEDAQDNIETEHNKDDIKISDDISSCDTSCEHVITEELSSVKQNETDKLNDDNRSDEPPKESKLKKIFQRVVDAIVNIPNYFNKIINGIGNIERSVDKFATKISSFGDFISDNRNQAAISKFILQIKYILKHLFPKVIRGTVYFGFDDPATTGTVLALLAMCAPIYPQKLELKPDFENAYLYGNIYIRGRFRVITVIIVAIRLLFDKNVRRLWKMYKKTSSK